MGATMSKHYSNFRRAQRERPPHRRAPINLGFWAALSIMSVGVFGAILFWPGGKAEAGPPASATIACSIQWVHDGDTFRCAGYSKSTRLYGIDAPEMPGACRPGRECVSGDPYASRDYLKSLVVTGPVQCELIDTDDYGRPVMRCWADKTDLSCAMVKAGYAVERYGRLGC